MSEGYRYFRQASHRQWRCPVSGGHCDYIDTDHYHDWSPALPTLTDILANMEKEGITEFFPQSAGVETPIDTGNPVVVATPDGLECRTLPGFGIVVRASDHNTVVSRISRELAAKTEELALLKEAHESLSLAYEVAKSDYFESKSDKAIRENKEELARLRGAMDGLLSVDACVVTDEDIEKNKRLRQIARAALNPSPELK